MTDLVGLTNKAYPSSLPAHVVVISLNTQGV